MAGRPGRRVAIVAGLRTPFVKSATVFKDLSALELSKQVVSELVQRAEIPPAAIDQLVFGTVVPSVQLSNIAREVGPASGLPKSLDAYSVTRAGATSIQATTSAAGSTSRAEKAWGGGEWAREVRRVWTGRTFDVAVGEDTIVRKDSKRESYGKLKPVFDRKSGSTTAGNSSPLTDGAAALVICSE